MDISQCYIFKVGWWDISPLPLDPTHPFNATTPHCPLRGEGVITKKKKVR